MLLQEFSVLNITKVYINGHEEKLTTLKKSTFCAWKCFAHIPKGLRIRRREGGKFEGVGWGVSYIFGKMSHT